MRDYEVVYIFKSSLTTEEIEGRLEAYHGKILAAEGSEITAVEHWGKRQLAYPIDRNDNGYYVVTQFTASPGVLPDFERVLKLDDDLLRHLVVLSEGEMPMPVMDQRGRDEDDNGNRRRGRDEGAGGSDGDGAAKTGDDAAETGDDVAEAGEDSDGDADADAADADDADADEDHDDDADDEGEAEEGDAAGDDVDAKRED